MQETEMYDRTRTLVIIADALEEYEQVIRFLSLQSNRHYIAPSQRSYIELIIDWYQQEGDALLQLIDSGYITMPPPKTSLPS